MNEKHYFQIIYWKLFTKIIVKIIFLNRKITSFENFKKIKKTGNLTQLPQSTALHATQFPLIPQAASFSTVILKEFFAIVSIEHASSTVNVSMLQRRWRHSGPVMFDETAFLKHFAKLIGNICPGDFLVNFEASTHNFSQNKSPSGSCEFYKTLVTNCLKSYFPHSNILFKNGKSVYQQNPIRFAEEFNNVFIIYVKWYRIASPILLFDITIETINRRWVFIQITY